MDTPSPSVYTPPHTAPGTVRTMFSTLRALFLLAVTIASPAPAAAHAILLDGTPAAGSTVPPGKLAVALRFNSRIDSERSRITLVRGSVTRILAITPGSTPDILRATTDVTPGAGVLRWQVLAIDGHITRGETRFTIGPAP